MNEIVNAIFDSGANISIISYNLIKNFNLTSSIEQDDSNFNTINNKQKCFGRIDIPITIGDNCEIHCFTVIQKCNFNLLLGLDIIQKFHLSLSSDLRVYQNVIRNNELIFEEIESNYSNNLNNLSLNRYCNWLTRESEQDDNITAKIDKLLAKYKDIFSKHKYDVGSISTEMCKIELTNKIPINQRPYRCTQTDQDMIDSQIRELLKYNLIRKSTSPYAVPITLADKKDEGKRTRLCMDSRKINEITVPDNFPFPLFCDIIDNLYNCEYFSTIDITSSFWHVKMSPGDIHKTAFVTTNDHFEWLRMPYGYRNSPAIFQRVIQNILKKYDLYKFSRNYLDDIIIFSQTRELHLSHLNAVLFALRKENIKLKLSKCKIAEKQVKYLGHIISKNKFKPLNDNLISIKNFPIPTTVKNVQQFLGKVNYYHKFIPNACKLLAPLYALLKKGTKFIWSDACNKSFQKVIKYLISDPILCMYNPNKQCLLFTDASRIGIAGVLMQQQDSGKIHPIGYFSKKLLDYQKGYDVTEIECLAIVEAIDYFHYYLYPKQFIVYTDHQALKWLKSVKKPSSRLFKWRLKLNQYNYEIRYIAGSKNLFADSLSRNPVIEVHNNTEHLKIVNLLDKQTIIDSHKEYMNNLPKGTKVENDLIIKINDKFKRIYITEELVKPLLTKFHNNFGHIGTKKMLSLIACNYYFKNMSEKIKEFLQKCHICQTCKLNRAKKLGQLSQVGPAQEPFDIVSIDTSGGLSGYNSRKQYIHIAIDHLTRYVWTLSSRTQTAKDFINLIKMLNKKPKLIIADRYTAINSNEFKNYLEKNNIKIMYTTVNCAQSNGLVERFVQTLKTRLTCKINDQNRNVCWPKILDKVIIEYNNTPHNITEFSPSFLMFGIKPYPEYNLTNGLSIENARKIAFDNSNKSHEQNKQYYDKKHNNISFETNDLVYIENKNDITRRKLEPIMIGPFRIVKKLSDVSYEVMCDKRGKQTDIYHISKLRKCHSFPENESLKGGDVRDE